VSRYIDGHRGRFGVEPICRTLGVSASAYYQRASGQRSGRVIDDERLLERIREVHAANYYAYGYRRTWKALGRAGEDVGRDRVKRLMRAHGIQGAKRRGKPWRTAISDPAATRSPDLVNRDFTADHPDALWVADFTYLRCWEGLVFFSFVIDALSRRVSLSAAPAQVDRTARSCAPIPVRGGPSAPCAADPATAADGVDVYIAYSGRVPQVHRRASVTLVRTPANRHYKRPARVRRGLP
jgi:hypothetical protein